MKKLQLTLNQIYPTTRHTKDNLGLHLTTLFHRSLAVDKISCIGDVFGRSYETDIVFT